MLETVISFVGFDSGEGHLQLVCHHLLERYNLISLLLKCYQEDDSWESKSCIEHFVVVEC